MSPPRAPAPISPFPAAALLGALLLAAVPLHGAAGPWQRNGPSQVRLVSAAAVAPRAGELRLGVHFRLDPGWHVYWKNSGDAGYPPTLTFSPAPGLGATELLWPAPRRFDLPGGLVAFGWEHEMAYPVAARLAGVAGDRLSLEADLDYLVCKVDCIPFRSRLTLEQPVGEPRADPETAPLLAAWWERLPRPAASLPGVEAETAVTFGSPGDDRSAPVLPSAGRPAPVLEIRLRGVEPGAGADLFLEPQDLFEVGRPAVSRIPGGAAFRLPLTPKNAGAALPPRATFAWTATGLRASGGEPLPAVEAREAVALTPAAPPAPPAEPRQAPPPGSPALPAALARTFLAGLLANLTPAVLALLLGEALALRALAGSGQREAAARVLAIAVALPLASRLAAGAAGPGPWAAGPGLLTCLALASTLLALNLWGLLELPLPPADPAGAAHSPDRSWNHALAGGLAPILALAWPLPWLGAGGGPAAGIAGALGFALPWLALAAFPRLAAPLPPPGEKARALREGLGFAAAAGTLWLLYRLAQRLSPESLAAVELALLALGLLAWVRRRAAERTKLSKALALALAAGALAALWLALPSNQP